MRLCIITGSYPPVKCGIGDYTHTLSNHLLAATEDIDLHIISPDISYKTPDTATIHNCIPKWNLKGGLKVIKLVRNLKPDIIHLQYQTPPGNKNITINLLPLIFRLFGCIVVSTIHEYTYTSRKFKSRNLLNILFSNYCIIPDPVYKKDINRIFPRKNIEFIPVSPDIPQISISNDERNRIRESLTFGKPKSYIIGYFGFVYQQKNIKALIDLHAAINKDKDCYLVFMADLDPDIPHHLEIQNHIKKQSNKEKICFTGYLDKKILSKYIQSADCMVFLFKDGISPRNTSFIAAAYQARMVIATDSQHPMPFITKEFPNVSLVDRNDPIPEAVKLITNDNGKNKETSKIQNESYFSWPNIAKRHILLYEKILNDSRS